MYNFARSLGYQQLDGTRAEEPWDGSSTSKPPNVLINEEAKALQVLATIQAAATGPGRLMAGDAFLLTFAGHGVALPSDSSLPADQDVDSFFCMYDVSVADDVVFGLLAQFEPGVRVFVISDCCHAANGPDSQLLSALDRHDLSGSAPRGIVRAASQRDLEEMLNDDGPSSVAVRVLRGLLQDNVTVRQPIGVFSACRVGEESWMALMPETGCIRPDS
jgi:hypothetical protein